MITNLYDFVCAYFKCVLTRRVHRHAADRNFSNSDVILRRRLFKMTSFVWKLTPPTIFLPFSQIVQIARTLVHNYTIIPSTPNFIKFSMRNKTKLIIYRCALGRIKGYLSEFKILNLKVWWKHQLSTAAIFLQFEKFRWRRVVDNSAIQSWKSYKPRGFLITKICRKRS